LPQGTLTQVPLAAIAGIGASCFLVLSPGIRLARPA
jgi:hypothetical protein